MINGNENAQFSIAHIKWPISCFGASLLLFTLKIYSQAQRLVHIKIQPFQSKCNVFFIYSFFVYVSRLNFRSVWVHSSLEFVISAIFFNPKCKATKRIEKNTRRHRNFICKKQTMHSKLCVWLFFCSVHFVVKHHWARTVIAAVYANAILNDCTYRSIQRPFIFLPLCVLRLCVSFFCVLPVCFFNCHRNLIKIIIRL